MRTVDVADITNAVVEMAVDAAFNLPEAERALIRRAAKEEESELAVEVLETIRHNFEIAEAERRPLCQDTGLAIVYLQIGTDVHLVSGDGKPADLQQAVDEGVRRAWKQAALRNSVVADPLERRNTGDNTPALVHVDLVPGEEVVMDFLAKGGGCENISSFSMLLPTAGEDEVIEYVVSVISSGGAKACPPLVVGVGLGGSAVRAPVLARRALFRPLGQPNPKPHLASLEKRLLDAVNATGIGPQGLGGRTTALAVNVEAAPCHITSLPTAVIVDCHCHRHRQRRL